MALASQAALRHSALRLSKLATRHLQACHHSLALRKCESAFASDVSSLRPKLFLVPDLKPKSFPSSRRPRTTTAQATGTAVPAATLEPETKAPSVPSLQAAERPSWKAAIDFKFIRDNVDLVAKNIEERKSGGDAANVVALYDQFVKMKTEVDDLRAARNANAAQMKGKLDPERRQELVAEGKRLKDDSARLEEELANLVDELQKEGQRIPNLTHPEVPRGGEEVSVVRKEAGKQREFTFPVKDHVELGEGLDLFDFDTAAEVSGQKFYYLKNAAVLLEMGLINWAIQKLYAKGFTPLSTPDLVRSGVVEKCGFQPRAENTQIYTVQDSDLCLAGTAEIPVGGLFMDKIIPEAELPIKTVAFSHCFRTEAGAAGRENRGLYRVHQFSKVEMFVVATPEQSDALHEELISLEEDMYESLGLHFKTLDMPSEDLGAPAYRKYDVEAWMPGLDKYGEISSASNCTDYQARRLNIRYRPAVNEDSAQAGKKGKGATKQPPLEFVHTLNATACAVPRMIICILENFQQEDGSVVVPEVLRPFMGGIDVLRPKE
ncbi:serine--tRNA ligase, chloroplast or mitochondrial [Klebsormidium nitens]|uniref:serine--tRNA ligase n=1 Tax=Klebsormidium nitens TaxID=105231 RepID=A0A1Y1IFN2_KLENI|nr:serine--tRNA ligase, chloroplast or mitochondrial [Klebsormidium nitens]|eukprot:GAQ88289.1 serine--tRNA ligase, chloroplast or mitochondrial [Klebsormidium nitens]